MKFEVRCIKDVGWFTKENIYIIDKHTAKLKKAPYTNINFYKSYDNIQDFLKDNGESFIELREFKFRAWVKYKKDIRYEWAYEKTKKRFKDKEPKDRYNPLWSDWYDEKEIYFDHMYDKYEGDIYFEELKMVDNKYFSIGKINTVQYGYEILDIMQYTGLKDKNGKEIYEGDILNKKYHNLVVSDGIGVVEMGYGDDSDGYNHGGWYGWKCGESSLSDVNEKVEVIGNIYENPELLQTK